jgi:DNA processing protein
MTAGELPPEAWVTALTGLSGMGPIRLRALLDAWPADEAWGHLVDGAVDPAVVTRAGARRVDAAVVEGWRREAASTDVRSLWNRHAALGVGVLVPGRPGFPDALVDDPEPPVVLFRRGDPDVLAAPRVAVVGTRRCTHTARDVAHDLGHDLAASGVCVLSGLALGVDGAAHAGALEAGAAPPAGVVATGLDRPYPARHAPLWRQVADRGLLLSEYRLGTRPEPWRFPARNRILAALADVVVVVESHAGGGSMHTVEAAIDRGRPVMAVPGSVRNPAAAGTNGLLAAGCPPVCDVADVLVALGLGRTGAPSRAAAEPAPPDGDAGAVLAELGDSPVTMEQLAIRLDVPLGPLAVHLTSLERSGWVKRSGAWFERSSPERMW